MKSDSIMIRNRGVRAGLSGWKKLVSEALVHIPNMYCTAKGLKSEKVKKKKKENTLGPKIITYPPSLFLSKGTIWRIYARRSLCMWSTPTSLRKRLLGKSSLMLAWLRVLILVRKWWRLWWGPCHQHPVASILPSPAPWAASPHKYGQLGKQSKLKKARRGRAGHPVGWSSGAQSPKPYASNLGGGWVREGGQILARITPVQKCYFFPHWNESGAPLGPPYFREACGTAVSWYFIGTVAQASGPLGQLCWKSHGTMAISSQWKQSKIPLGQLNHTALNHHNLSGNHFGV